MTYFLACIEPRLFLVTVCDGRRAERDGGVNSFIQVTEMVVLVVLVLVVLVVLVLVMLVMLVVLVVMVVLVLFEAMVAPARVADHAGVLEQRPLQAAHLRVPHPHVRGLQHHQPAAVHGVGGVRTNLPTLGILGVGSETSGAPRGPGGQGPPHLDLCFYHF